MGSLEARLERLETRLTNEVKTAPPWSPDEQIDSVLGALQVHRWGGSVYLAIDREINLAGILHARDQLPGGVGEFTIASGVVVTLTSNEDGTTNAGLSGNVSVEDLPSGTREHLQRMDPEKQPERERRLPELYRQRIRREKAKATMLDS